MPVCLTIVDDSLINTRGYSFCCVDSDKMAMLLCTVYVDKRYTLDFSKRQVTGNIRPR